MADFSVIDKDKKLPKQLRGAVVAIGNFDGVHKGHQYLLQKIVEQAKQIKAPALVLTFEPHPRVFKTQQAYYRLTKPKQKYNIFKLLGVDAVIEQVFDTDLMSLSAPEFVKQILLEKLGAKIIVVGQDFCFGKDRKGNIETLNSYKHNFQLDIVSLQKTNDNMIISSSNIRNLLAEGKVEAAAHLLNYHYIIENIVIHGAKLGRKIGYPTINMEVEEGQKLLYGIYAVKIRLNDGRLYDGVASFGKRPTVEHGGKPILETYIFDFDEDIYGESVEIIFFDFLRKEQKFENIEQLVAQIKLDVAQAQVILHKQAPLSLLDKNLCF